jgi:hypothetical protein
MAATTVHTHTTCQPPISKVLPQISIKQKNYILYKINDRIIGGSSFFRDYGHTKLQPNSSSGLVRENRMGTLRLFY